MLARKEWGIDRNPLIRERILFRLEKACTLECQCLQNYLNPLLQKQRPVTIQTNRNFPEYIVVKMLIYKNAAPKWCLSFQMIVGKEETLVLTFTSSPS